MILVSYRFLADVNLFRLLLGINEEKKEIVCGLVDTIGSYTFAKTLEYKAKQGLAGTGKDVTVIPPNEYEERFVSSMDSYFVACPGASFSLWWSRCSLFNFAAMQINGRNLPTTRNFLTTQCSSQVSYE